MKEILPFFILCIFFSNKLSSQDIIQKIYGIENGFNSMNVIESMTFAKDTLFASKMCKEYEVNVTINSLGTRWEYYNKKKYLATEGLKEYIFNYNGWYLDYDYSLLKCDTLKFNFDSIYGYDSNDENASNFGFIVDSVYSESIYGGERIIQTARFYYYTNNNPTFIQNGRAKHIQGIGSIVYRNEETDYGFYVPDQYAFELYCHLRGGECFGYNSLCSVKTITDSYHLSNLCDSILLTSVELEKKEQSKILRSTIATEFLEILDQNAFGIRYEIYASNGHFVQRGVISDSNVNIGNLLPGLYFISFYNTEGKRRFERFYKSE